MTFRDLKIITFIPESRDSIRSGRLSDHEIFCGPDCETFKKNQSFKRLNTVLGYYDAKELINETSVGNKPDLIIVKTDSLIRNMPKNLVSFNCPKVLIVEDMGSDFFSSKDLLLYAAKEGFDFISSETNRRELELFKDAGFNKVFWSPALNLKRNNGFFRVSKELNVAYKETSNIKISESLPLTAISKPAEFGLYLLNLVKTGKKRLNDELFHCLENGGLLLTNVETEITGLSLLFQEGKHFKSYASKEELHSLIEYYLSSPEEALKVAKASFDEFEKVLSFDLCRERFLNYIFSGEIEQKFLI